MTQILVTHLTRMRHPYICVAGIELSTGRHIRPVLARGQIHLDLVGGKHGFAIGRIVDLGPTTSKSDAPHTEDRVFEPSNLRGLQIVSPSVLWGVVDAKSGRSLTSVFGKSLTITPGTAHHPAGSGLRSLGYVRPTAVRLSVDGASVRARLEIADRTLTRVPVNDSACYLTRTQSYAPNQAHIDRLNLHLEKGQCVLSVGLTRPFAPRAGSAPVCWLQVNGIYIPPRGA